MQYLADRWPWPALLLLLSLLAVLVRAAVQQELVEQEISIAGAGPIPSAETAFTREGTVLRPYPGAWDARFDHGSAGALVEKDGTFYLYYIGASGDRASDGGPAHRKVGVATASSPSGPWTRYPANPLLEHSPNGDAEEGFWRVAAMVDDDGTILLYATVLAGSGGSVKGDIKLFTSTNGISFADGVIVLPHNDEQVFGSGDELGVLGIYKDDHGTYHLYYTAKAEDTFWTLGHASGPGRAQFTSTAEAYDPGFEIGHGSSPVRVGCIIYIPLQDNAGPIEIHATDAAAPGKLGTIAAKYPSLGMDLGSLYLKDRWYLTISGRADGTGAIQLYTAAAPDLQLQLTEPRCAR